MIISKTPIRISFLGGGTDYQEYFKHNHGSVLGVSIDKYSYLNIKETHRFHDYNYRISYSKSELADNIEAIEHPSVKACLKFMEIKEHFEIHYMGDWPARTGLGSSSSFTVGLLHALHSFKNENISKAALAEEAIHVEKNIIGENVGWQDQVWAAYGGLATIQFSGDNFSYQPLCLSNERIKELKSHLLLAFTGIKRFASNLLEEQINKTINNTNDAYLKELDNLVDEGAEILYKGEISAFGELLDRNWQLKKQLSTKVSNTEIDKMYETALQNGASGGKILGAGGGGFVLLFAKPSFHRQIMKSLSNYKFVEFDFDFNGSQIIYYNG